MEVAGLVLGALPVAIQAIQTYRTILSSMTNTKRDLEWMIRDLKTEMVILQNTCEISLRGIASDSEIESMIENPYSEAWKKYSDELSVRMGRSGQLFQDRVEDMMEATAELQEKLALDHEGKTRLLDRISIFTELKLKTSFTLKKDEYTSILARLHDGNAVLSVLAKQNSHLEPSRRLRSQIKAASLIRKLSAGIFSAIQGAMTCSCIGSHDLGLLIAERKPVMLSEYVEENIAKLLHFDVFLGTYGENPQRWDGIRVKLADKIGGSRAPTSPPPGPPPPKKRRKWASSLLSRSTKVQSTSSSYSSSNEKQAIPANCISNTAPLRPPITNLCHTLRKGKGVSSDCYGFINNTSNEFYLYHQDCLPSCGSIVTLRDILEGRVEGINNFGYPERLKLALTISFGVFHLYSTPWLSKAVTLDDIVFLHGGNTEGGDANFLDRPFLTKKVPLAKASLQMHTKPSQARPYLVLPQTTITPNMRRPIDPTLLSLGLLLVQIIVGKYFEQLRVEDGMTMDDILEKQTMASKMAGLVLQDGGMNYAGAVQWCLENFLSVANLDNEELAGQFYDAVISKLEIDMKFQSIATSF